jgi:uncharacterized protein (TIGR03083 family)
MTPRYDGERVLRIEGLTSDPSTPLLRQRRRLTDVLARLDADQWAAPTRCDAWSVKDVVAHLVGINELWEHSVTGGRDGAPTRFFATFDPVVTPALLVDAVRGWTAGEMLARYVATTEALAAAFAGLDETAWSLTGETPLGHVGLDVVAAHALWDSWLHERDVLLPLGLVPAEDADEAVACLCYAAAVSPALLAMGGSTRSGRLAVTASDPAVQLVVDVGSSVVVRLGVAPPDAIVISGRAVDLTEALSLRTPTAVELPAAEQWLLGGLTAAFDVR